MEVQINQQLSTVSDNVPLFQVLEAQGLTHSKGIAVAVNNTVVPKNDWKDHILRPNDKIMIIRATQGG